MSNYIDDSDSDPIDQHGIRKGRILDRYKNFGLSKEINRDTKIREINHINIHSSQDFALKLSDNSTVEDDEANYSDTEKNVITEDEEIIEISDSSVDSNNKYSTANQEVTESTNSISLYKVRNNVLVLSSSDSTPSEKVSKANEKSKETFKITERNILQTKPSFYISSSSESSLSTDSSLSNSNKESNKEVDKSGSTHISPTPQNEQQTLLNTKLKNTLHSIKSKSTVSAVSFTSRKIVTNNRDRGSSKTDASSFDSPKIQGNVHKGSPKTPSSLVKLTRRDMKTIFKNIKSNQVVYQSPREKKNDDLVVDDTSDEEIHPALLPSEALTTNVNKASSNLIDETVISDSGNVDKQHPQRDLFNSDELNEENEKDKPYRKLSERKKKEISEWLMTNTEDCRSDSSFSFVPPSSKNSISSGNSSLERLEMNYETPNNRGRLLKNKMNNANSKPTTTSLNKRNDNAISPRKTVDKHVESIKDTAALSVKPTNNNESKKSSTKEGTENMDVIDCADILDKLYGNTWRSKAQALLRTPVQRIQNTITKDRAVQTERKILSNIRRSPGMSRGRGKPRNMTVKTTKLPINATKNSNVKNQRNNFINDWSSSSDSENETYHTAFTHPRTSADTFSRKPLSATTSIKKIFTTLDSDSKSESSTSKDAEDSYFDTRKNLDKVLNRRKLSFSDDESNASTSEFDPEDEIPDRRIHKRNIPKPVRGRIEGKNKNIFSLDVKDKQEKPYSFLASLSETVPITKAHPDAKKFRLSFKNSKDELCSHLFKLYNEKVFDNKLPNDMKIEWNVRMRGTAGYCYNKRSIKPLGGIARSSRIVLATKILDTPDRLRDTLIHEMCHAAAWLINDVSDGHGPFWTAWANKAMKVFPELPPIRRCHDYKINTKFTYRCMDCGYSIGRHSKSLDVERKRCGYCYGKFEILINKTTKSGTVQIQTPKREPSAFALFVKENYSSVKKERNAKHAEVMKILGQQFSAVKIAQKHDNNVETSEAILLH